jgi:hypothetical protein
LNCRPQAGLDRVGPVNQPDADLQREMKSDAADDQGYV